MQVYERLTQLLQAFVIANSLCKAKPFDSDLENLVSLPYVDLFSSLGLKKTSKIESCCETDRA